MQTQQVHVKINKQIRKYVALLLGNDVTQQALTAANQIDNKRDKVCLQEKIKWNLHVEQHP